ncbi:MAG: radical SAM protein [Deltaproteobacteria bacterium]|nr:radical SAM protein [Candidatus Poribacteria bacterium]MBM4301679.1 radical SAM protein [Deltaproteobacteria bacterium]
MANNKKMPIDNLIKQLRIDNQPFQTVLKLCHFHTERLNQYFTHGETFPIHMEVSLTNKCNQKCPWCLNKNIRNGPHTPEFLNIASLSRFLRDYKKLGGKSITWSGGGEPTCHPNFNVALRKCNDVGLQQALITNGTFNDDALLSISENIIWVRFSIDTIDKMKYLNLKGTDIDIAMNNITNLIYLRNKKKYPKIGVNFNISYMNIDEIDKIIEYFNKLGVDYIQFRPMLWTPFSNSFLKYEWSNNSIDLFLDLLEGIIFKKINNCSKLIKIIVSKDKFSDLKKQSYGREYKYCSYHHFVSILNSNGDICTCMFHLYDDRFSFGNINKESLQNIWNGAKRKNVLRTIESKGIDFNDCQVCCKGQEINKFIDTIKNNGNEIDLNNMIPINKDWVGDYDADFL